MIFTQPQQMRGPPSCDDRRRKDLSRTKLAYFHNVGTVTFSGESSLKIDAQTASSPLGISRSGKAGPERDAPELESNHLTKHSYMSIYITLSFFWTLYMAIETYIFGRPQSRPHFVGFLITHLLLAPISFTLSVTDGVLRERIETAYGVAWTSKRRFAHTGRKKLIG